MPDDEGIIRGWGTAEALLKEGWEDYVKGYDYSIDDVPPLDYEGWRGAYAHHYLRDGGYTVITI